MTKLSSFYLVLQFLVLLCIAYAQAGYLGGGLAYSSLGYSGLGYHGHGYSGLGVAPVYSAYSAPIVTKALIPAVYAAPAVSHVSRYDVHHSAPIIKSYIAPVSYGGVYGGYGGYGYGGKYLW